MQVSIILLFKQLTFSPNVSIRALLSFARDFRNRSSQRKYFLSRNTDAPLAPLVHYKLNLLLLLPAWVRLKDVCTSYIFPIVNLAFCQGKKQSYQVVITVLSFFIHSQCRLNFLEKFLTSSFLIVLALAPATSRLASLVGLQTFFLVVLIHILHRFRKDRSTVTKVWCTGQTHRQTRRPLL